MARWRRSPRSLRCLFLSALVIAASAVLVVDAFAPPPAQQRTLHRRPSAERRTDGTQQGRRSTPRESEGGSADDVSAERRTDGTQQGRRSGPREGEGGYSNDVQYRRNILILSHNVSQDAASGYFDVNCLLTGRIDVLARCVNTALWISNGIRTDTRIFLMLFPHNITIEVRGDEVRGLNPDERTMAVCLQRTLLAGRASDAARSREVPNRFKEKDDRRPSSGSGKWSVSEKKAFRIARKGREAMLRRIHPALQNADKGGGGSGTVPRGFLLHRHDSLARRLRELESGGNNTTTNTLLVLDELGAPLSQTLTKTYDQQQPQRQQHNATTSQTTTTTIILGDQRGYAPCDEQLLSKQEAVTTVSLGPVSLLASHCIALVHNWLDLRRHEGSGGGRRRTGIAQTER